MRARTTVIATLAAGALALTATAALAGATAAGPSEDPAAHHHGVGDMASMHDDMLDAYPGMATHMAELGTDLDQLRDSMLQDHRHADAAGTHHAHDPGWMHD